MTNLASVRSMMRDSGGAPGARILPALVCALSFLAIGAITPLAAAADPSWLDKVDQVRAPADNFTFEVEVTGPDQTQLEMTVRVRDRVKTLVRYTRPAKHAGRALLFVERNMWVYIPGSRRPLRISPQQQVLGGVASADIARVVYSADYAVEKVEPLEAAASSGGAARHRLHLAADGKGAAYARIELEVEGEEARPLKSVFWSASGRKLKTAWFEDYQEVLGRMRPTVLRVVDHLEGDAETLLRYRNHALVDTPAAWFQPSWLKRLRE